MHSSPAMSSPSGVIVGAPVPPPPLVPVPLWPPLPLLPASFALVPSSSSPQPIGSDKLSAAHNTVTRPSVEARII
jgi:hypothetical protein